MIESRDISKMVTHIIRRDKGIADPQIMHPSREWFRGLGIATLIVVLGSWFCLHIYTQHLETVSTPLSVSEPVVPYQAATIAEAISIFEAKQAKFSEILGTRVAPVQTVTASTTSEIESEVETATLPVPAVVSDPQIEEGDVDESESVLAL
ncbi:MAG: hypothetical protein V4606_04130 [Patescibacteria group bacterium]